MSLLRQIYEDSVLPAYALLPTKMNTPEATATMLTIGLQESRLIHQQQIKGPAKGLYQFEKGGGVRGVLNHAASKTHALHVCKSLNVGGTAEEVYWELQSDNDILDSAFARLLLWTDPYKLPGLHQPQAAWELYLRTWRPGKPHPGTWEGFYKQVMDFMSHG